MSDAVPGDPWMRPVGHDPAGSAGWTRLGTLDGPSEPIVDARGVVQVAPGLPGVDWWIAGDDRWYFPTREKTVRQSIMHGTPVVETRMRVKGGDVIHRVAAVTVPGDGDLREVLVIEIENATGVPCGAAFAVRPFGVIDDVPVHRITLEGGLVSADGRPVLVMPRSPSGALAATGAEGDLVDRTAAGEATGAGFPDVDDPDGRAQAVVVVPLAHRNTFRVVVPVPDPDGRFDVTATTYPGGVPPAENVARGWKTQIRDLTRVTVPDPRLQAVGDAAPAWLLATTSPPLAAVGRSVWDPRRAPRWDRVAATAGALDRVGLHERSGLVLARAVAALDDVGDGDASWLVGAFAGHLARTGDVGFAAAVSDATAAIVAAVEGRRGAGIPAARRSRILTAAADVLEAAGQTRAARRARRAAATGGPGATRPPDAAAGAPPVDRCAELDRARVALAGGDGDRAWQTLDRYLDEVTSTGVWSETVDGGDDRHDVGVGAAVASLVYDLLGTAQGGRLRLLAHLPPVWVGSSLECTNLRGVAGSFGYAVRWHGRSAALLWELAPYGHRTGAATVAVSAPGLDGAWRGEGPAGEALLAEVPETAAAPRAGSRMTGLQIGQSRGGS